MEANNRKYAVRFCTRDASKTYEYFCCAACLAGHEPFDNYLLFRELLGEGPFQLGESTCSKFDCVFCD